MKKITRMQTTIIMATIATQPACLDEIIMVPPPPPIDMPFPPPMEPTLWCERVPLRIWYLSNGAAVIRNMNLQRFVMPRLQDCTIIQELIQEIPFDCLPADCGQFEHRELPSDLTAIFEELSAGNATTYEIDSDLVGNSGDALMVHWIGHNYEMVQMSVDLDMPAVLGVGSNGGVVAPAATQNFLSITECTPCHCSGGSDPIERPEAASLSQCLCPAAEGGACDPGRVDPEACDCYDECCP